MELDEETVVLVYKLMTDDLTPESASYLKGSYHNNTDMMACLGRALFNEKVVKILQRLDLEG